jgi:hypothetical protein
MASQVDPAQLAAVTCQSVRIDPPPVAAVLRRLSSPRVLWSGPAEQTVVGSGAAVVVHATGDDRFTAVQSHLGAVWDALAFDGDARARPRALGGFGFLPTASAAPEWQTFPPAQFVIPELQVSWEGDAAWVTRTQVGSSQQADDLSAVAAAIAAIGSEPIADTATIVGRSHTPAAAPGRGPSMPSWPRSTPADSRSWSSHSGSARSSRPPWTEPGCSNV